MSRMMLAPAFVMLSLLAAPAAAQMPHNCWWDGIGMHCRPGWGWDRDRREERREEWRERRDRKEEWRRHEYCRWHGC